MEIWTDGSSINHNNKWFGGCGAILLSKGKRKDISEGYFDHTNNMCELKSISLALRALNQTCTVDIMTDSQYSIDCITKWSPSWKRRGWKTSKGESVKNRELIIELLELCETHKVTFVKVKAHTGIQLNEEVDQLAYKGAKDLLEEYKLNYQEE